MPITLSCPSCDKRFRARDESAGKRVKCPFCQAAVPVPAAGDGPAPPPPPTFPPVPLPDTPAKPPARPPAPAQSQSQSAEPGLFDVAGRPPALSPVPPPKPAPLFPPPPPPADDGRDEPLFGVSDPIPKPGRPPKPAPPAKPTKPAKPARADRPARPKATPEEQTLTGWRKVKGGLGWVQFALPLAGLVGIVPFAGLVYERFEGPLPTGDGAEWVKVDGYINTDGPDAVRLNKTELIEVAAYGVPLVLGGLAVVFGRLGCGNAPKSSGVRGLFLFSGLLALVALAGAGTWAVGGKAGFGDAARYGRLAAGVGVGLSEFWFLLALGAVGAGLKRPRAVRAVGGYALVLGLAVVVVTAGWAEYERYAPEWFGRSKPLDQDWTFYEAAAKMAGWLLVVGSYWRAVGGAKRAIKDHLRSVREMEKDEA